MGLPTFEVDKEGLRKLLERRPPGFAVWELTQNAWDEDVTRVEIELVWEKGMAELVVTDDDPEGFTDIAHAYTLFAESEKKVDATKRGRFNLGEKYVIAICDTALIETTSGTIVFDDRGRVHKPELKRSVGSRFIGRIPMARADFDATVAAVHQLIPPQDVTTIFNGEIIEWRKPVKTFDEILPTEIADDEGRLKRSFRKATISLYEPGPDEEASIYEMGIPVVATGDRWHVDIGQKVPLNVDRDNVTPSYLQDVRRVILDHAHELLDDETAAETWVTDAVEDKDVSAEAVAAFVKKRFGDKVVKADPSDPEATKIAVSEGYTVLTSRMLPKTVQTHIRTHEIIKPAGQVTPSPKPYKDGEGSARKTLARKDWTPGIELHVSFAKALAVELLGREIDVEIVNDSAFLNFSATYSRGAIRGLLEYNLRTLGRKYFDRNPVREEHLDILIHEFGHQTESDHLSRKYLEALTALGARATVLALAYPGFYAKFATATPAPEKVVLTNIH